MQPESIKTVFTKQKFDAGNFTRLEWQDKTVYLLTANADTPQYPVIIVGKKEDGTVFIRSFTADGYFDDDREQEYALFIVEEYDLKKEPYQYVVEDW